LTFIGGLIPEKALITSTHIDDRSILAIFAIGIDYTTAVYLTN
jgi:hypothetical protein